MPGGVHTPTVSNEQRWFHNCQTGITPLVSLWFFGGRTARLGVMKSPISGVVSSGKECVSRVLDCHCHVDQAGRANTSCRTVFTLRVHHSFYLCPQSLQQLRRSV